MKVELTIFTPTYNRCEMLKKLYKSLIEQSNKEFVWMIVDDGSTDETKEFVEQIKIENKINIEYYYKSNGGKHTAMNLAIDNCNTSFLLCIDSDDSAMKNDVEVIYKNLYHIKDNILGLVFPRKNTINQLKMLKRFDEKEIDIMDLKFVANMIIETSIVFSVDILKRNKFPVYKNEKFLSEEILYNKLCEYGKFKYINQYVVNSEYLESGLTNNIYTNYKKSFNSSILLQKSRYKFVNKYDFRIRIINQIKAIININALCIVTKKNIFLYTPSKLLSILLIPISIIWGVFKYE